jgi:hypothetical protein
MQVLNQGAMVTSSGHFRRSFVQDTSKYQTLVCKIIMLSRGHKIAPGSQSTKSSERKIGAKPSDRLNPKAVNNLVSNKHKTAFSAIYCKGGIPW